MYGRRGADGTGAGADLWDDDEPAGASIESALFEREQTLFNLDRTVGVDRGMAYDNTLKEITDRELHYLVASRQSERDGWLADFEDTEGFEEGIRQPSPRNPLQEKSHIQVKRRTGDGETLVLCLSSERKEKDRAIREKLDGSYILKSDRDDLSAEEAWRFYLSLTRAENAFRSMKSPLLMRPIHHQLEARVEPHIFLSVLAYHLLVAIEKTLLDQEVHTSWATVRETLRTHPVCTVVLPADGGSVRRIRRASTPESQHVALYELLGVPTKIMAPRKTRSDAEAP